MEYALLATCLMALSAFIAGYRISKFCTTCACGRYAATQSGREYTNTRRVLRVLYPLSDLLLKNSYISSSFEFFSSYLHLCGIGIDSRVLISYCILAELVLALIALILTQSLLLSLLIVVLSLPLVGVYKEHLQEKIARDLEREIPHFYKSFRNAFLAGQSIEQALRVQLLGKHRIMRRYICQVVNKLDMGYPLNFALDELKGSKNSSLIYMTLILEVQHKMGSSIAQIINEAIQCAQEKLDLQNSLKVQTAQARFSSQVVSVLPLLITLSFSFISPNFMKSYFSSLVGILIFSFALLLQGMGVYVVRSLIKKEKIS